MRAQVHPGGALAQEAVARGAVGEVFGLEGLERHGAVLLVVKADVDDAHAAHHRAASDFVTVGNQRAGWVKLHQSASFFDQNGDSHKLLT